MSDFHNRGCWGPELQLSTRQEESGEEEIKSYVTAGAALVRLGTERKCVTDLTASLSPPNIILGVLIRGLAASNCIGLTRARAPQSLQRTNNCSETHKLR